MPIPPLARNPANSSTICSNCAKPAIVPAMTAHLPSDPDPHSPTSHAHMGDIGGETSAADFATTGLTPIEASYVWVIRARLAVNALILILLTGVGEYFLAPHLNVPQGIATGIISFALILLILTLPIRRVASIRYHMDQDHIRIRRGFLFTVDTIVPFVRVQHIDVSQGPIERSLGLSSLSVYTSGVVNLTVTLPGLETNQANIMREAIHRRIITDFE